MALFEHRFTLLLSYAIVLIFLSSPVAAFGAGNIGQ